MMSPRFYLTGASVTFVFWLFRDVLQQFPAVALRLEQAFLDASFSWLDAPCCPRSHKGRRPFFSFLIYLTYSFSTYNYFLSKSVTGLSVQRRGFPYGFLLLASGHKAVRDVGIQVSVGVSVSLVLSRNPGRWSCQSMWSFRVWFSQKRCSVFSSSGPPSPISNALWFQCPSSCPACFLIFIQEPPRWLGDGTTYLVPTLTEWSTC